MSDNLFNLSRLANVQNAAAAESETRMAAQSFWNAYRGFQHLYWTAFKKMNRAYIQMLKESGEWEQFVTEGQVNWEAYNNYRAEQFFKNFHNEYGVKANTFKGYQAGVRKICKAILTNADFIGIKIELGDPEDSPALLLKLYQVAEVVRETKRQREEDKALSLREDLIAALPDEESLPC